MKTSLPKRKIKLVFLLNLIFLFLGITLANGQVQVIDAQGTTMKFNSSTKVSGSNLGQAGGYAIYDPLCTVGGIDIKGKLTATVVNNVTIETWDNDTENPDRFQPEIDPGEGGGYVVFKLEFFDENDQPVYLSNFNLTGVDCDGNNDYQEYYKFSTLPVTGYGGFLTDGSEDFSCIQNNSPEPNVLRFIGRKTETGGFDINNYTSFLVKYNTPTNEVSWEMGIFFPQRWFDCSDVPFVPNTNNYTNINLARQFSVQLGPGHQYSIPVPFANNDNTSACFPVTADIEALNVLDNDLYGELPTTTNSVDILIVGQSNPNNGISLDTETGIVTINSGASAGTYSITYEICNKPEGTKPADCSQATVTVNVQDIAITELTGDHYDLICIGGNDGSFKVEASGGTPPYSYRLSDSTAYNNTTGVFEGLTKGVYAVYAKDANDCETMDPLMIEIFDPENSNCRIIKENCPPFDLVEECFDGEGGTPVYWTPPRLSYTCCTSGEGDGYSFDMDFNLPESQNDCWIYNSVQRVGSDNLRLHQSATYSNPGLFLGNPSDVFFVVPFQYFDNTVDIPINLQLLNLSGATTVNWELEILKANAAGTVYTLETSFNSSISLPSGTNPNPSETPHTINIPAETIDNGIYRLKFKFTGGNNKVEVDYIKYDAILPADGSCSGGINFAVTSNYKPGDEFPIGTTKVTYIGTLTQPDFTMSDSCTFDVIVNDSPVPTGDSIQDFCSNESPSIADLVVGGDSIKWYADSIGGSPLNIYLPLTDGEDYFATQTLSGCESLTRLKVEVVINDPDKPTGLSAQNFCTDDNATVADLNADGENINWYASLSSLTPLVSTFPLMNDSSYYATQTVDGCESIERFMVTVGIEDCCTDSVKASAQDSSICVGSTIDLVASFSGADYNSVNWVGPNGFQSSQLDTTFDATTTDFSGNYIVTVDYGSGCVAKDTVDITVLPLPTTATVSSNSPICFGENAVFTITGVTGDTVYYSGAATGKKVLVDGEATVTVSSPAVGTVKLNLDKVTNTNNCVNPLTGVSDSVTVNPLPDDAGVEADSPICFGENAVFTITGVTGDTVYYSGAATGKKVLVDGEATVTVSSPAVGTVKLNLDKVTNTNNCVNPLTGVSDSVTVNPLPDDAGVEADSPICFGENAVFTITGVTGDTVYYSGAATGKKVLVDGEATVTVSSPAVGTVKLNLDKVTNTNNCVNPLTGVSDSVTVNPLPDDAGVEADSPICFGENAVFTITGVTGDTVYYSGAATGKKVLVDGEATVTVSSPVVGTVKLNLDKVTNTNNCVNPLTGVSDSVTVNPLPDDAGVEADSPICFGENAVFTITGVTGDTVYYSGAASQGKRYSLMVKLPLPFPVLLSELLS